VLPLVLHRINPVFAAYTIEQTRPTFKNGLINFLLLRRQRDQIEHDELAKRVFQGLQFRTAVELAQVTTGTTVDRLHVIRLGYVLASLVTMACLYLVLSPKNPLVSFGRVILPWARIGAPTRVAIDGVRPGDCAAYQGDTVVVSAEVHGLRASEPVLLYYSSTDDQLVDQSVPMSVPQGGLRHQGQLPPGSLGLQQSLLYRIAAGDAASPTFRIDMQIPPTIVVDRVEYDYPEYTGLKREVKVQEGDLLANEGTRVTIHATANYPIAQAYIELEGDEPRSIRMSANGTAASGRLTLAMNPHDSTQPEFRWYHLRFTDSQRRENPHPIRHRIHVIPDLAPKIHFVDPPPEELTLPVNRFVQLKLHAEDPDFGLRRVAVCAEREGRKLLIEPPLLDKPRPSKPHKGPFEASYRFEPARLGLKPGDKVVYWGEAADCKEKEEDKGASANVTETERRTIVIVPADGQQPPGKLSPQDGTSKKRQPGAPEAAPSDKPDQGPEDKPDAQPDGEKDKPQKPSDQEQGKNGGQPKGSQSPDKNSSPQDRDQGKQPGDEQPGSGSSGVEPGSSQPQKSTGKGEKSGAKQPQTKKGEPADSSPEGADESQPNAEDGNQADKAAGKKGGSGGKDQKPSKPVDGPTDPGEAIRRILEHQQEQQGGEPSPSNSKTEPKPGQQPSGQQPQAGQSPDKQPRPGDESARGERKPGDSAEKADKSQGAAGKKSDQSMASEDRQPAEGQKGEKTTAQDKKGESAGKEPMKAAEQSPTAAEKGESGQSKDADGSKKGGADSQKAKAASEKGNDSAKGKSGSEEKTGEQPVAGEKKGTQGSGDERKTQEGEKSEAPETGKAPSESKPASEDAKGAQSMPGAEEEKGKRTDNQEKGPKGGEAQPHQEPGGAGRPAGEKSPSPSPQDVNQPHGEKQGRPEAQKKTEGEPMPQSPSTSPKTSQSKGESDGDKSGGGKSGGGQRTPQPGQGTPGSQSPADEGGQQSGEKGPGETGTKAGNETKSDQSTGKQSPKGEKGGASGQKQAGGPQSASEPKKGESSKQDADSGKSGQPSSEPSAGQNPGQEGGFNSGNPTQGGSASKDAPGSAAAPPPPPAPDDPNLEYAKKQTSLALEHLADQIAKEKSDLLPQLGWDKKYAEDFIRQWEEMRKAAAQPGPQGEAAKRELDKALRSLGLRLTKSKLRPGQGPRDDLQHLQDGGRFEPPPDWRDKFRAYNQGD
jgi:hypothetical protein